MKVFSPRTAVTWRHSSSHKGVEEVLKRLAADGSRKGGMGYNPSPDLSPKFQSKIISSQAKRAQNWRIGGDGNLRNHQSYLFFSFKDNEIKKLCQSHTRNL